LRVKRPIETLQHGLFGRWAMHLMWIWWTWIVSMWVMRHLNVL